MMTSKKDKNISAIIKEEDYIDDIEPTAVFEEIRKNKHQEIQKTIAYLVIGGYIVVELMVLTLLYLGINIQTYESHTSEFRLLVAAVIGYYFGIASK
ncbi:MAG: hypothetical protein ABIG84_07025 [archaeon]